uniref:Homeodomain mating-type protein HD1-1 n=1 Tax=Auricularia heimuer TaxID=1579977 RepID=A0A7D3V8D5_9AGAM|nr:homeodomain mating-type protein HD1-1 [Auricularia heimuer]
MSRDLEPAVRAILPDFLAAVRGGDACLSLFCESMNKLHQELLDGASAGTVSPELWDLARSNFSAVAAQGKIFASATSGFAEASQDLSEDNADDPDQQPVALVATLPLFRYFLANICSPYADSHEKERVAQEVRDLGWHDYDKKKFEDWLNRKRIQSGFIAILHRYCHDDRHAMRRLCHTALFGTAEERAKLPDGAVEDIEDMRDFVQSQYDELREEEDSTWMDELATRIHAVTGEDFSGDEESSLDLYSDEEVDCDSSSDSASDWSDTDVDDEDDVPPTALSEPSANLATFPRFPLPLPVAHSLARHQWHLQLVPARPPILLALCPGPPYRARPLSSGATMMMCTPVPRSGFANAIAPSQILVAPPFVVVPATAAFFSYRTKRRRTDDVLTRRRPTKRSHYASLGVASQNDNPCTLHLFALSDICSIDWTTADSVVTNFDVDPYTIDCTPPDFIVAAEEFADLALDEETPAEDILTWSKLQMYTISRMLLPAAARPLPPALAKSMTLSFDTNSLSPHDVTSLGELFALTPEDIAAMYASMNTLAPVETSPSVTAGPVSSPEDPPSPTSSSGCSSPPALSDDSGSSTRSSSVEPASEQESLLMSPARLRADYSQPYGDLFDGKALNSDSFQLKVKQGAMPDVGIAGDELSGAADLLARYLKDSTIAV